MLFKLVIQMLNQQRRITSTFSTVSAGQLRLRVITTVLHIRLRGLQTTKERNTELKQRTDKGIRSREIGMFYKIWSYLRFTKGRLTLSLVQLMCGQGAMVSVCFYDFSMTFPRTSLFQATKLSNLKSILFIIFVCDSRSFNLVFIDKTTFDNNTYRSITVGWPLLLGLPTNFVPI